MCLLLKSNLFSQEICYVRNVHVSDYRTIRVTRKFIHRYLMTKLKIQLYPSINCTALITSKSTAGIGKVQRIPNENVLGQMVLEVPYLGSSSSGESIAANVLARYPASKQIGFFM